MALIEKGPFDDLGRMLAGLILGRQGEIRTDLTPKQCAERLAAAIDSDWTLFGSRPARGSVRERGGHLRRRLGYRNDFQSVIRFRIEPSGRGSRILYRLGPGVFVTLFMLAWFCGVLTVGVTFLTAAIRGEVPWSAALLIPPFMLAAGAGMVAFGGWLSRNDGPILADLIARSVEGRVA